MKNLHITTTMQTAFFQIANKLSFNERENQKFYFINKSISIVGNANFRITKMILVGVNCVHGIRFRFKTSQHVMMPEFLKSDTSLCMLWKELEVLCVYSFWLFMLSIDKPLLYAPVILSYPLHKSRAV